MTASPPPIASPVPGRWAAGLFIGQFLLIWTTFFILSSAIDWPASLGDPADIALPRLLDHQTAVMTGYACYLLAALLIVPAMAAFGARLSAGLALDRLMMGLAGLSAIAKTIGIGRWLFAMPGLARAWAAPGADRPGIATVFRTLNDYAGGIGEIVGVGLLSGVLTILIGWAIFRQPGQLTRAVGGFAIFAGVLLFANIPARFGVELGGVLTLSNIVWQFALLGVGLWSLTTPRPGAG